MMFDPALPWIVGEQAFAVQGRSMFAHPRKPAVHRSGVPG